MTQFKFDGLDRIVAATTDRLIKVRNSARGDSYTPKNYTRDEIEAIKIIRQFVEPGAYALESAKGVLDAMRAAGLQVTRKESGMTPALRLRTALTALGWSQRELARHLAQDERTVRRWALGEYPCPEPVLAWLEDGARRIAPVTAAWLSEAPRPGRANASPRGPNAA